MANKFIRLTNPPVITLNCEFVNSRQNKLASTTFGITRTDLAMAPEGKVFSYNGHIPGWCKTVITDILTVCSRTSEGIMCTLRRCSPYSHVEYIWLPF